MWKPIGVAIVAGFALVGGLTFVRGLATGAVGPHHRVVPGLAADSAGPAAPTPTPTPPGGAGSTPAPGGSQGLVVTVIISIRALELSATPTGTVPVMIDADATVDMPTAQLSSAAAGTFAIGDHPMDAGGCAYPRTDVSTAFSVIVYRVDEGSILMGFTSPEWHYTITCPGGPPIRLPAFGEESLALFLRNVMGPYYAGPNTVRLPLLAASEPGCLKQYGTFSASGIQADPAQVYVYVHAAGCTSPG